MKSAIRPLRKTRVTWPKLDCLNPNLDRIMRSPAATLVIAARPIATQTASSESRTRRDGYLMMNQGVEMSGGPNSRSSTMTGKHEIAYGARALWRRSPNSSPRAGKPSTWRSGAGNPVAGSRRYA